MHLLQGLNGPQEEAVRHNQGPLLVLAGPGSGKTRVITQRIAYLVHSGVSPDSILALTFTNKAAQEMATRVEKLLHQRCATWVSTFHSFCARILRQECSLLGYHSNFSIYDTDDQKRALKHVLATLKVETTSNVADILSTISKYKSKCLTPDKVSVVKNYWAQTVVKIYGAYQEFLRANNALDFDDLLLRALEIFTNYNHVRQYYQDKFRYILLDEFQDTNMPQYLIAKQLGQHHQNICATGDPDQSIYSWRGADINNILQFERDFPDTRVIKLEQNYRSTGYILKAASGVIAHNKLRKDKTLWTQNPNGDRVELIEVFDDNEQAEWVCRGIEAHHGNGRSLREIVVFYRINAQSRPLETALRQHKIPYVIVGGVEFYQRAEIKDVLAYLRVMVNRADDLSLLRIINVPPRGLGKKSCGKLGQLASDYHVSLMQAIKTPEIIGQLSARAGKSLQKLAATFEQLQREKFDDLSDLVEALIKQTGYLEHIRQHDNKKDEDREANIREFILSVQEYQKKALQPSLQDFLEKTSLLASIDKLQQQNQDHITLMTLHSAKGLEFPIVYIIGVTEGLLPHQRSFTSEQIEEERRLFFVGMTRAQKILTLCYSKLGYGQGGGYNFASSPSRFLEELPSGTYRWRYKVGKSGIGKVYVID